VLDDNTMTQRAAEMMGGSSIRIQGLREIVVTCRRAGRILFSGRKGRKKRRKEMAVKKQRK